MPENNAVTEIVVNVNQTIRVSLTPYGLDCLINNIMVKCDKNHAFAAECAEEYRLPSGEYEFTLWDYMNLLGEDYYHGGEPITVRSEIILTAPQPAL